MFDFLPLLVDRTLLLPAVCLYNNNNNNMEKMVASAVSLVFSLVFRIYASTQWMVGRTSSINNTRVIKSCCWEQQLTTNKNNNNTDNSLSLNPTTSVRQKEEARKKNPFPFGLAEMCSSAYLFRLSSYFFAVCLLSLALSVHMASHWHVYRPRRFVFLSTIKRRTFCTRGHD